MGTHYNIVAAKAVLKYLVDNNMYDLARVMCERSPYLALERSLMENGIFRINHMQEPLNAVMREYDMLQDQVFHLVDLCESVIDFTNSQTAHEHIKMFIDVLTMSGRSVVLDTIINQLPAYAPEQPPVLKIGNDTSIPSVEVSSVTNGSSVASATKLGTSEPSEILTTLSNYTVTDDTKRTLQPTVRVQQSTSAVALLVNDQPVTNANMNSPEGRSIIFNPNTIVDKPGSPPDTINSTATTRLQPTTVTGTLQSTAGGVANVTEPSEHPEPGVMARHPLPTVTVNGTEEHSNDTPLDNPIEPGTSGTRSTSSRKRSHVRTLDFGTPPRKRIERVRESAKTVAATAQPNVSERPAPCSPVAPANSIRGGRMYECRNFSQRTRNLKRVVQLVRKPNQTCMNCARQIPNENRTRSSPPGESGTSAPQIKASPERVGRRSVATSPTHPLVAYGVPDSPMNSLGTYPMTPRFFSRPLQPLNQQMLSPFLHTSPAAGSSTNDTGNVTKTSGIKTPRYPITPGCTKRTPSPRPDGEEEDVPYYRPDEANRDAASRDEDVENDGETDVKDGAGPSSSSAVTHAIWLNHGESAGVIEMRHEENENGNPATVEQNERPNDSEGSIRMEIVTGDQLYFVDTMSEIKLYEDVGHP